MTDVITINNEIEALGLFAATCDVMACDLTLNHREREMIEARATRYRALQLEAMAKLPAVIKSTAKSIISDMEAVGKESLGRSIYTPDEQANIDRVTTEQQRAWDAYDEARNAHWAKELAEGRSVPDGYLNRQKG